MSAFVAPHTSSVGRGGAGAGVPPPTAAVAAATAASLSLSAPPSTHSTGSTSSSMAPGMVKGSSSLEGTTTTMSSHAATASAAVPADWPTTGSLPASLALFSLPRVELGICMCGMAAPTPQTVLEHEVLYVIVDPTVPGTLRPVKFRAAPFVLAIERQGDAWVMTIPAGAWAHLGPADWSARTTVPGPLSARLESNVFIAPFGIMVLQILNVIHGSSQTSRSAPPAAPPRPTTDIKTAPEPDVDISMEAPSSGDNRSVMSSFSVLAAAAASATPAAGVIDSASVSDDAESVGKESASSSGDKCAFCRESHKLTNFKPDHVRMEQEGRVLQEARICINCYRWTRRHFNEGGERQAHAKCQHGRRPDTRCLRRLNDIYAQSHIRLQVTDMRG